MPTFVNWSRNVRSTASVLHRPTTEAEVQEVVRAVHARGGRVRVTGAGHSWSAIAAPNDAWLQLDGLSGLVGVRDGVATVRGGTRLHDLNEALAATGHSPTILGSIAAQSIAGAIATGTHGSSLTHGNLASFVRRLRLVTGTGEVVELHDADAAHAAVHLGVLGVVTEVDLAVEPLFHLRERRTPVPLADALGALDHFPTEHEYAKWWWLPHTDAALLFDYTRCEPGSEPAWKRWVDTHLVNRFVFPALLRVGRVRPTVPTMNRLVRASYFKPSETIDRVDRQLTLAMPPRHREAEWAIPVEHAREAVSAVVACIEQEDLRVNFILEVRWVKGDDAWMSPAHGGDRCAIGAYIGQSADQQRYFDTVADVLAPFDPRPHWGKESALQGVGDRYPELAQFRQLARRLDPDGVFSTPHLAGIV